VAALRFGVEEAERLFVSDKSGRSVREPKGDLGPTCQRRQFK
jgi:hypothetical protein